MDPMLPLLGIKMEAVAIVGKSLGQDTCCDVEQVELAKKKLYKATYIYINIYIYICTKEKTTLHHSHIEYADFGRNPFANNHVQLFWDLIMFPRNAI